MSRPVAVLLLAAGIWTTGVGASAAPDAPKPPVVGYHDGRVTATLKDAPLNAVLQQLAHASTAELRDPADDPRPITAEFHDVPLQEALERLLGEHNFTLRYEEGRLKTIEVKGVRQAQTKLKAAGGSDESEPQEPAKWIAIYRLFDGRGPVEVDGKLKQATGNTGHANWDMLVNTAIANEDPRVRRAAVRAGMKVLQADRDLYDSVVGTAGDMSDEDLAMLARKRAHYRAEDLVKNIIRESSDREIRTRATGVLGELRKMPYQGPIVPMH